MTNTHRVVRNAAWGRVAAGQGASEPVRVKGSRGYSTQSSAMSAAALGRGRVLTQSVDLLGGYGAQRSAGNAIGNVIADTIGHNVEAGLQVTF